MACPGSEGFVLKVRVSPGAKEDKVLGPLGDELKISLSAPPQDGRANAALVRFLAESLGVRKASVTLQSGASQRSKLVRVEGIAREEAERLLGVTRQAGAEPGKAGQTGAGQKTTGAEAGKAGKTGSEPKTAGAKGAKPGGKAKGGREKGGKRP